MITAMAEAQVFFVNVKEENRGNTEENTYIAIYGDTKKRPLVMGRLDSEGFVLGVPSPQMRDMFLKRLDGKELPAMGTAAAPSSVSDVQDI